MSREYTQNGVLVSREYHPFTIHIADRTGKIVRTYHPKTGNEWVMVNHDEIKEFDVGWPMDMNGQPKQYIQLQIATGNVTMGKDASITFTYQYEFYSGHSVLGLNLTGSKLKAIDTQGEVGDTVYSSEPFIKRDMITVTSDGKIDTS